MTTHKSGVTPRLKQLMADAGGVRPFARKVWGNPNVDANIGKVARWKSGQSGISHREGKVVAAKCGVSLEWLLTGEGPEIPGASRPVAQLADDIRAAVRVRVKARGGEAADLIGSFELDGERTLDVLAQLVGEALPLAYSALRDRRKLALLKQAVDAEASKPHSDRIKALLRSVSRELFPVVARHPGVVAAATASRGIIVGMTEPGRRGMAYEWPTNST